MTEWGRKMYVTPGVVVDGKLVTTDLVDINLNIRILLGSSYYDDWEDQEMFVKKDPLGNPVDQRHPWNQTTNPTAAEARFGGKYTWVMSPRWYDKRTGDHLALDTGGGPIARLLVDRAGRPGRYRLRQGHRQQREDLPAQDRLNARGRIRVEDPEVEQRHRARPRAHLFPGVRRRRGAVFRRAGAGGAARRPNARHGRDFKVPDEAIGCGFHEAVRGVLSHHVVIRDGKIANYHPYPPTPWNANPRDIYGTPGPYEDAVQNTPIFEENGPDKFKGIDIMRAVRSFDPACRAACTCTSAGEEQPFETVHSPTQSAGTS